MQGWNPDFPEYQVRCQHCEFCQCASGIGAVSCHPEFQQWWKRESRVVLDVTAPAGRIKRDGRDALHIRWHSRTSSSVFEALRDRETLRYLLIAIDGKPVAPDILTK